MTGWGQIATDLSRQHRVIAYNRRGYPGSGAATTDIETHGRDAASLLEALDAGPATVCGHSFGAIVAVELAHARPDLVRALVLLEPMLHARRAITPGALWAYGRALALRRLKGEESATAGFCRWMMSYAGGGSAWSAYPPERRRTFLNNASGLFADLAAGDGRHLPHDIIADLDCPVTVVIGERTRRWFRRNGKRIARETNGASVSVRRAGHDLMFDQPNEVASIISGATVIR
jgi:pimeloyl-ACP methyl ester carboxylesterase